MQSTPHARLAHLSGVVVPHTTFVPAGTQAPAASQLNGSSEPSGVQSTPHARPEHGSAVLTGSVVRLGGGGGGAAALEQPRAPTVMAKIEEPVSTKRMKANMRC